MRKNNSMKRRKARYLIPLEYERDINKHSGFLTEGTDYAQKSVKGLFLGYPNVKYLSRQMISLLTSPKYIDSVLGSSSHTNDPFTESTKNELDYDSRFSNVSTFMEDTSSSELKFSPGEHAMFLARLFKSHKHVVIESCGELIDEYKLPNDADFAIRNPVVELSIINKKFLIDNANAWIKSPDSVITNYNDFNPETGKDESGFHADFSAASYSTGVWKPEDLFLNVDFNKQNGVKLPSWTPVSIEFNDKPDADGIGGRGPGNRMKYYGYSSQNGRGHVDPFQATLHRRPYEKDNTEGLSDGGLSDRRTQKPHGYNMDTLLNRSSF